MLKPSIDKLLGISIDKFTLVIATSKRARQLKKDDVPTLRKTISSKSIGIALEEIEAGTVKIMR